MHLCVESFGMELGTGPTGNDQLIILGNEKLL